ncbi:unnamed protein product [Tuber aestivum]|uniref:Integrase zinc-binding domain-containing protein n=1 Tax=Tuber aestivum TaxID=59557 RepID=A0A292PU79_9PEZI|nr:unnamed protein product [Tuber aestivum]
MMNTQAMAPQSAMVEHHRLARDAFPYPAGFVLHYASQLSPPRAGSGGLSLSGSDPIRTHHHHQRQHHHHHHHHQPQQHHHQHQLHQQHQQQEHQLATALANSSPKQQQLPSPASEMGNAFEDTPASLEGFPTQAEFENLLNEYILSLSPKKRDKALIPQKRYDNILAVLRDPKCTTIESAQFRFWAKKMFRLVPDDDNVGVVCHEGKPVAVREQLYHVLTSSHGQAQHGGRDKTSAQVRKYFSWVPKELIARFVRNCPSCTLRRSNPLEYSVANSARQAIDTTPTYITSSASSSQRSSMSSMSSPMTTMPPSHQVVAQLALVSSPPPSNLVPATANSHTYSYSFPEMPLDPRMYGPSDLSN